jgi:multisubunit Na+/H+ antiporter MnhB subunit
MGKYSTRAMAVFIMALAIWVFFYVHNETLDGPGTLVVVAASALVVFALQWLWARLRRTKAR